MVCCSMVSDADTSIYLGNDLFFSLQNGWLTSPTSQNECDTAFYCSGPTVTHYTRGCVAYCQAWCHGLLLELGNS